MDGERFDRMTRGLLSGASRRSLLAGLIGGAAATVVGAELLEARKGGGRGRGRGNSRGRGGGKNNKSTICHCPDGDVNKCKTIRVGGKAKKAHLRNHCDYNGPCRDEVVNPCDEESECLAVIDTIGDVTDESDGRYTLSTEGGNDEEGGGNLVFGVPAGTTFAEIESIVAQYDFADGSDTCGGGSPRFVIFLENGNCPYVQFPPEGCDDGEGTTGELVDIEGSFIWIDDLKCDAATAPTPVYTYDEILARYANVEVESIELVVDESPDPPNTEKTVTVDVCITIADDDA